MTFLRMKTIEPELQRLEESARFAGRRGASWIDVLFATNETLTKAAGRGASNEALQSARAYEVARHALHRAWCRGEAEATAVGGDVQRAGVNTGG